jgi:hypothetical protein
MANSKYQPFTGFSVAATTTETALNPQPYANTHTITVYNSDTTEDVFLRWQDNAATAMTAANSVTIPATTALTLAFGPASKTPVGSDTNNATNTLFVAATGNATAYVTYVNGASS